MRRFLALLLAAASFGAAAQKHVLIEKLPANLTSESAMALTRSALIGRSWKVLASDATSITAANGKASVRIYLADNTLLYDDQAEAIGKAFKQQRNQMGEAERLEPVAPRLVAALRADLASALGQDLLAPPVAASPLAGRVIMAKPSDVDAATMMRAVRLGLTARGFTILPSLEGEGVVVAQLSGRNLASTWRVFVVGNEVQFTETTTRVARGGEGTQATDMPERWIANVRSDIEKAIPQAKAGPREAALPPSRAAAEPARPAASASERLRTLKQLFDSGDITRDEYDRKRTEILRDL